MDSFYIPMKCLCEWKSLLAQPDLHWKDGYSAKSLAVRWTNENGIPSEVQKVFKDSGIEKLANLEPLFIFPEYQVPIPHGKTKSQNDIYVLARGNSGQVVIMVEGKVKEKFGEFVKDWLLGASPSSNKPARLAYLQNLLGLSNVNISDIRYQLLHRTASVIIEAERIGATSGIVLVHSFCNSNTWFSEFQDFVALFNVPKLNQPNSAVGPTTINGVELYFAWVTGQL